MTTPRRLDDPAMWVNPYAPAEDLVPVGTWPVRPTEEEGRNWRHAVAVFFGAMHWLPPGLRVIWFSGGDPAMLGETLLTTSPTLVLLRAGRRPAALFRTALHELRHVSQASFSLAAWDPEEREADAKAFVRQMGTDETGRQ